jgi:tetratricopeptide (TPR) repeat protein
MGYGPYGEALYQYTLKLRIEYWIIGVKIAMNWPITGVGTDSYIEGFKLLRGQSFVDSWGSGLASDSAHNVVINFMANYGFVNSFLLLVLVSALSYLAICALFMKKEQSELHQLIAIMWLGLVAQSMFSIEQLGLGSFQWLIGALLLNSKLVGLKKQDQVNKINANKLGVIKKNGLKYNMHEARGELSLILFLVVTFIFSSPLRDEMNLRTFSLNYKESNESNQSFSNLEDKLTFATKDEVRRAITFSNFLSDTGRVVEAEAFLLNVVERDPQAIDAIDTLARIQNYYGRINEEIYYREMSRQLNPWNPANSLALAIAYDSVNRDLSALNYAQEVLRIAPKSPEADSATVIIEKYGVKK